MFLWKRNEPGAEREKAGKEGVLWRCPMKGCRREVSLRKDTFFEGSHLEIEKILRILNLWSTKTPLNKMRVEVEISRTTAVDWYNFLKRMTGECFLVEVQQRDAATLLPIVQNFVRPGSIVYSDEWPTINLLLQQHVNTKPSTIQSTLWIRRQALIPQVLRDCGVRENA